MNLGSVFYNAILSIIKYNNNIAALLSRRDFGCRKPVFAKLRPDKPVFAKLGSEDRVCPSGVLKIGFGRIIKAL